MEFTTKRAEAVFNKLRVKESSSNHHRKGFLTRNGERLFPPIYFSKGRKKIPDIISEKFRKSLFLNEEQFIKLISCKMGYEEYFEIRDALSH